MKETVIKFGPNKSLLGILTEPDNDKLVAGSPTAVILNAGITHRVGPFRLHVNLARELAESGYRSLRLDLSGLGDSQIRDGKKSLSERAELDVKDAFDALGEKLGLDKFVLIGLCSGAFNSHRISVAEDRVVGAVFMDGIAFRTPGFYLRQYMGYLRPRKWRNAIKRRLASDRKAESDNQKNAREMASTAFFDNNELCQETTKCELQGLLDRGVRMLFLYTDGYDDVSGPAQFKEMFGLEPNRDLLQLEYYETSEHTFRLTENRKKAVSRVADWYQAGFGLTNASTITSSFNGKQEASAI